jgi:prepilin-type N-terminal cleavage/methylation domain-containing protein
MNSEKYRKTGINNSRGFTLLELLVAIIICGLLGTLAYPPYADWRKNVIYRKAVREIVSVFRETKSRAISSNREHRIEFEPAKRRFRVMQGNKPFHSSEWEVTVRDWTEFPAEVLMSSNEKKIQINTNGTANGGTIKIMDTFEVLRYVITVNRTGRIRTS